MDARFKLLESLGAGDFQHLNGDLETHLKGTSAILKEWGASELLQTAGLFHAAYGTAGFDESMVSLEQRASIAEVIGQDEEKLVYLYCSCDRGFVFPQFDGRPQVIFRDRFNQKEFVLSSSDAALFCELTVANELELVYASEGFKQEYGKALYGLFRGMEHYLSEVAICTYREALEDITD